MKYKGSCHCGKVAFEVEGEFDRAMSCNCSMCSRKGSLLWFVPRDQLHVITSEENIGTYTFNKHVIQHRFCQTCGIPPTEKASIQRAIEWLQSIFAASKELNWKACRFSTSMDVRCSTMRGEAVCVEASELYLTSNRRLPK